MRRCPEGIEIDGAEEHADVGNERVEVENESMPVSVGAACALTIGRPTSVLH